MLLIVLLACSPGNEFDVGDEAVERIQKEYGITSDDRVDLPDGSRVVFFGDSITAGGIREGGYVTVVKAALDGLYPNRRIQVRGSGVEGDKVTDLSRRLRRDVLARKPTHVVIYVGVNDAASLGPGEEALGEGLEVYRTGLTDLVTRIRSTGAWAMVCTPGVIGENLNDGSSTNEALERYAATARSVAAELGTGLCDLRTEFSEYLASRNPRGRHSGILTVDGIHLNSAGNRLVARAMLRALVTTATPVPIPDVLDDRTIEPAPRRTRPSRAVATSPVRELPSTTAGAASDFPDPNGVPPPTPSPSPETTPSTSPSPAPEPTPTTEATETPAQP